MDMVLCCRAQCHTQVSVVMCMQIFVDSRSDMDLQVLSLESLFTFWVDAQVCLSVSVSRTRHTLMCDQVGTSGAQEQTATTATSLLWKILTQAV